MSGETEPPDFGTGRGGAEQVTQEVRADPDVTVVTRDELTTIDRSRLDRLEGEILGVKQSQASVVGALSAAVGARAAYIGVLAVVGGFAAGGFALLYTQASNVDTRLSVRIDGLENKIDKLPGELMSIANNLANLVAASRSAPTQSPPVIIQMPQPTPPQPQPKGR